MPRREGSGVAPSPVPGAGNAHSPALLLLLLTKLGLMKGLELRKKNELWVGLSKDEN